jgi:hypothetical protein
VRIVAVARDLAARRGHHGQLALRVVVEGGNGAFGIGGFLPELAGCRGITITAQSGKYYACTYRPSKISTILRMKP